MVFLEVKPNLLKASCYKEEVLKGAGGLFSLRVFFIL